MTDRGQQDGSMKGTVLAVVAGGALLLAASDQALAVQKVREARAETVAPQSWGETNSGNAAPDEEESHEREAGPTENRNPDKASPKLF